MSRKVKMMSDNNHSLTESAVVGLTPVEHLRRDGPARPAENNGVDTRSDPIMTFERTRDPKLAIHETARARPPRRPQGLLSGPPGSPQ